MIRVEAPSYPVSIFMAGDIVDAQALCQAHCDAVGLCVTLTECRYIYTGGNEPGFVVGLINYPRFPRLPDEIFAEAKALAAMLMLRLDQQSYTIQAPDKTAWFPHRAAAAHTPQQSPREV